MTAPKTSASTSDTNAVSVGSSALFAVGDAFTFIGDGYTAAHTISSIDDDGWIDFGESKMLIHRERLRIAFDEGRARRVDSANKEAHQPSPSEA